MYYLIALPLAALLYHSIWNLGKKYMGREPFWLKVYAFATLIYIFLTPVSLVHFICERLGIPGSISFYLTAFVGITVLVLAIKFYPKEVKDKGKEWN
jgi:hypothetical protein